jgi:hypothetical protein
MNEPPDQDVIDPLSLIQIYESPPSSPRRRVIETPRLIRAAPSAHLLELRANRLARFSLVFVVLYLTF